MARIAGIDGNVFVCPLCGDHNLHMMQPIFTGQYEQSGADYQINIPFWCESNCHGFIEYHHHEGITTSNIDGESE